MSSHLRADGILLSVALVWGTTFVVVQNAVALLEPLSFNTVRFTIAAGVLASVWWGRQGTAPSKRLLLHGALLGFWLCLAFGLQTVALTLTTSSKTAFLTGLYAIFVPLFTLLILKRRPAPSALLGVTVAVGGLFLLTGGGLGDWNPGDVLAALCGAAFALHIVFTARYTQEHAALPLTVIQTAVVALLSAGFAGATENWRLIFDPEILFSPEVLGALIVTGIFATAIAFFAQTYFQKHTTPTRVALIFIMEPVFAAFTGVFWAGEVLSAAEIGGCGLILAGMLLAELPWERIFRPSNPTG